MNIEAMAREAGGVVYRVAHDRLAIDCDNMDGMKFAALVRAEALREAAGIINSQWHKTPSEYAAAILAAIDQPKEPSPQDVHLP